jgi:signal transduction histidine kinase
LPDDFVRSIYRDNDGSLWIGTRRGLSHLDQANHFTTYTQTAGLGSDLVGAILRDSEGDLWIGTFNGLSRLVSGRLETYRMKDGLSSNIITALHEDAGGDLWIGTQDAGLNIRHNGKILRFSSKLGLPDAIFGIAEDAHGGLWFASKAGIVRANRDELKQVASGEGKQATVVWYGTSDGLRINECSVGGHPEVWKASDGTIWFSTQKGVAALYPNATVPERVLPPVVIESIAIDGQAFAPGTIKQISPGHSRFAFEYTGLSFAAPQKLVYRYKLEGFDKGWIDADRQRTAYYTNIPPGRYRFRVIARNMDGFWNETGATLSFRLEPHFYQTAWFYVLAALGLGAAGYLIYRWRVKEVESRFNAVLQERNRIGREIHDTLAQGIVGVSVQLEIVSRLLATSADTAREHLDQARVLVRESLAEARRYIWQLRSESIESEDLASRLSKSARQAVGLSPVKLSLEVRGSYRPLGQNVEDELLRIGQEAVMNALRHAHPERIDIELAYTSKKLCMTIADDGCGFIADSVTAGPNGHYGLKGMRERAEQINATLVVDSAEGQGTRISVEAPLS